MILCDYGCGQEAIYQFKNGKWCCSKNYQSCPKSILIKENTNTNKICSYGCGQSAKFLIGKNEIPCCEISNVKCPEGYVSPKLWRSVRGSYGCEDLAWSLASGTNRPQGEIFKPPQSCKGVGTFQQPSSESC